MTQEILYNKQFGEKKKQKKQTQVAMCSHCLTLSTCGLCCYLQVFLFLCLGLSCFLSSEFLDKNKYINKVLLSEDFLSKVNLKWSLDGINLL